MPVVTFLPSGRTFNVLHGSTLLRAAIRARVPIASSCRGTGACKACRVRVLDGASNLSLPEERERQVAFAAGLDDDERLACFARVLGPVSISTTYW